MTPLEMTHAMYASLDQGDWDSVADWMAEDLVIREPESLPFGGDWKGRDAMQRLFGSVMGYWDNPVVERTAIVGNDDLTVTLVNLTVTSKISGTRFTSKVAETTYYRDGKVCEIIIHYFDPLKVAQEAWPTR